MGHALTMSTQKNRTPDTAIHLTFKKTRRGDTLATVRAVTANDVKWYRVTLPEGVDLSAMYRSIILGALHHMERHGGPAVKLLAVQPMLPSGEG